MLLEKKGLNTHLKLEQLTMANGKVILETVTGSNIGLMEPIMKASGSLIKLMEMDVLYTLGVIFIMGNGGMIKPMAWECMFIQMVLGMRAFGKMISKMEKVRNLGLTVPDSKENISAV